MWRAISQSTVCLLLRNPLTGFLLRVRQRRSGLPSGCTSQTWSRCRRLQQPYVPPPSPLLVLRRHRASLCACVTARTQRGTRRTTVRCSMPTPPPLMIPRQYCVPTKGYPLGDPTLLDVGGASQSHCGWSRLFLREELHALLHASSSTSKGYAAGVVQGISSDL